MTHHDPTFWLLARASGLTAYVMLTLSVLAGLVLKSRPFRSLKPAAVTDLHRILAMLGLGALAGHAAALVLDTTVKVSLPALVVPGLIAYRPIWTSVGVLAAELMVLVYASFSMRKRIGTKNWRRLHWATYGLFGGDRARDRGRHRQLPAVGVRALRARGRLRRDGHDVAVPRPSDARSRAATPGNGRETDDGRGAAGMTRSARDTAAGGIEALPSWNAPTATRSSGSSLM